MKRIAAAFGLMMLGLVLAGVIGGGFYIRSLSPLAPWHTVTLDAEFTAERAGDIRTLEDYLRLEDRLFAQLDERVLDSLPATLKRRFNRFTRGGWSDPTRRPINWNRTIRMIPEHPRAVVLLLHGLSDSPYVMRSLAEAMHRRGAAVVVLRLPGHGTAPGALTRVSWPDMAAAVRLAARDLNQSPGQGRPFYMAGFSTGAALAVEYCLSILEGEDLPRPDGLLLLAPALAVSPAAALANGIEWLSRIPGLEKLAWTDIQPEFDPYKYNSFPLNAGDLIYRLDERIRAQVGRLDQGQGIADFPPVLAVQSVTDATIQWAGIVDGLLARLAGNDHTLVLLDANRHKEFAALYGNGAIPDIADLFVRQLPFRLSVITNRSPDTRTVMVREKPPFSNQLTETPLDMSWPRGIYSVSHVALPISPNDPAYGDASADGAPSFSLGTLAPRGETGLLQVPAGYFLRLRFNPFFDEVLLRGLAHFKLDSAASGADN